MTPLSLQRGQRLKLSQITSSQQFVVGVNPVSPSLQFDISCFGLDEAGKLSDERFFVFYNQKVAPQEAIKMLGSQGGDAQCFWVDLGRLPPAIRRLMWVISVDGVGEMKQMGASHLRFLVGGGLTNRWQECARFAFSGQELGRERALMVTELYFKDEWRLNAIGQGFAGGLDAVLTHFGGQIAEPVAPTPPAPPLPPTRTPPQNPVPSRQNDGKTCVSCGKSISFWEKTTGRFNATTGRCATCENAAIQAKNAALSQAQSAFLHLVRQPVFDGNAWRDIKSRAWGAGVTHAELLGAIRPSTLQFLENLVEQSAADGIITSEEDRHWENTLRSLDLPAEWIAPFRARWQQEKTLSTIRQGTLPRVQADVHLASDETCHLLVNAQFLKQSKTTTQHIPVRLVATNKKLYIREPGGSGKEISYAKFLRVLPSSNAVTIELSARTGAGTYYVDDPMHVDAVLNTLVKIGKRQLVMESSQSRTIPHDVKVAVWQRDGGKCVQCGANGRGACLEYDHDIPFSKGGASTVGNLRLLCRRCNLDKGGRI